MKKFSFCFLLFFLLFPILAYTQSYPFCGEIVKAPPPTGTSPTFYDRFGNIYSLQELNASNYPKDVFLEDCNSGIFTLEFGTAGNAPAWTMNEMQTACAVFNYVSTLVASGTPPEFPITIRLVKDPACASDAAGTPMWDSECGIGNSTIFNQIVSGFSNYPPGYITGIICIRPTTNWHTLAQDCSPTNPCLGSTEVDLYTGLLHEVLHVVGFASRIGFTGAALSGGFYSRWDKFLRSSSQNAYLLQSVNSPTCCDHHTFNTTGFPNMPTSLSGDCSLDVFFFDGTTNIAEVNNDMLAPVNDGTMANKLSHLDNNCTANANFVINPELPAGTHNRII